MQNTVLDPSYLQSKTPPWFPTICWSPRCWQQEVTQPPQLFSTASTPLKLTFYGFKEGFEPEWCLCATFSETRRVKNIRGTLKGKGKLSYGFYPYFCSRSLRVPLAKFSVVLPLQFSICSGELHCFSPHISESQRVCFMGLFVCFTQKKTL